MTELRHWTAAYAHRFGGTGGDWAGRRAARAHRYEHLTTVIGTALRDLVGAIDAAAEADDARKTESA